MTHTIQNAQASQQTETQVPASAPQTSPPDTASPPTQTRPQRRWIDRRQQDRSEEVEAVFERFEQGDQTARPELRRLLEQIPALLQWLRGRPDWENEDQLIAKLTDNPLQVIAMEVYVDSLKDRIPRDASDLRSHFVYERLMNTWLQTLLADRVAMTAPDDENREVFARMQERAHRRHLSTLHASFRL